MHVAVVSSIDNCRKISEDIWLASSLRKTNIDADIVAWDDCSIDWEKYNGAVLRSVWNYPAKYDLFSEWLDKLDSKKIPLINDTNMVRWNIRKDLQFATLNDMKLPIFPYVISNSSDINCTSIAQELDTDTFVIKPVISNSGKNTFIIDLNNQKDLARIKDDTHQFIVQPFIENIKNGEYALVFINGKYSHAAIRFPGIFTEKQSPMQVNKIDIPESILSLAMKCSSNMKSYFGKFPAYARYDIVDGYIMEVELAEPDLMTRTIQNLPEREYIIGNLAKTIAKRIEK